MKATGLVSRRSVWKSGMLALACAILVGLPANTRADEILGDLGDAPDSTNHPGAAMLAYPGVPAAFPTVYDPMTGFPSGPLHLNVKTDSWLGQTVSAEHDADLPFDADGILNIRPVANDPDNDWFDDGVFPANAGGVIALPQCQPTMFNYIVTGAPAVVPHPAFVNVWFDWNHDGDWQDVLTCVRNGVAFTVPEWAVQNQVVNVTPGPTTVPTPPFRSFHAPASDRIWMRITLGSTPAPLAVPAGGGAAGPPDGRGPIGGYPYGETEDYLLVRTVGPNFANTND
jgi:hypothetical protein